ncbi:MAG: hypothetical protein QXZ68_04880 [Candidatus Bathyarchaeia archaeon]
MAPQKTRLYYAFIILLVIIAFIVVIWRSWIAGGAWWEYLWKPGEVEPGTRPARALPWEIQVLLMIIIIVVGIIIAVAWHKHVTKK